MVNYSLIAIESLDVTHVLLIHFKCEFQLATSIRTSERLRLVNCTEYIPVVSVLIDIKPVIGLTGTDIVRIPDNQYKLQAPFCRENDAKTPRI